jgi:hypothetical protein
MIFRATCNVARNKYDDDPQLREESGLLQGVSIIDDTGSWLSIRQAMLRFGNGMTALGSSSRKGDLP